MLNQADVEIVKRYFSKTFKVVPEIVLDPQNIASESYILLDKGGLSIGKLKDTFVVCDKEGEEVGRHKFFSSAILQTMIAFAREMFRRVNDELVTEALAQELVEERKMGYV